MSLIKAIKHQLGLSVTPANNFTFTAEADNGTMKLARGNAGATTQDVMTVDAAGKVAFPQNVSVAFRALAGNIQSIAPGSYIKANLGTISFDTNNNFSSSRFTPTVAGYYQFSGAVYITGTWLSYLAASIYKNGAASATALTGSPTAAAVDLIQGTSVLLYMNGSTDYVELFCYCGGGTAVTIQPNLTWMTGFLVRN